jgi:hypothetical protein
MPRGRDQGGQAAVELVALLPALALAALVVWQVVAAAHTWVLAQSAARAGARAAEVGAPVRDAVREVLPRVDRRPVRVAETTAANRRRVTVTAPVPAVLPGVRGLGTIEAAADVER